MIHSRLSLLSEQETASYTARRLAAAGCNNPALFTPEAMQTIYSSSRGIPRVVNLLCEHALISAFVDQKRPVQVGTIDEVAREFDLHRIDPIAQPVEQAGSSGENATLMEALQNLATLVDRLRRPS